MNFHRGDLKHLFSLPVIVAALGYFVDIYDLLLFGIVRIPSLNSLGLSESEVSSIGASILNWQMTGMLLGGILWGVFGDKKGRLSVLFGSIITYSLANIACGFVQDPTTYKIIRFIAGVGLAGELGAGITLVSESIPKHLRALGTSIVAFVGLLGAVVGYLTVEMFDWRTAYFVGGGMGFALLFLRMGVFETPFFKSIKADHKISKGNFFALFAKKDRFIRYLKCIGMGIPSWFVIGVLCSFSNEIGKALGITEPIKPGLSIMWCYIGLSIGDLANGIISHYLQSRKKAVLYFLLFQIVIVLFYLSGTFRSATGMYLLNGLMGLGGGYWAMFVTIGAEQFGTNLRATAATTIPNMVRGTTVIDTVLYQAFKGLLGSATLAAGLGGLLVYIIAIYSITTISETHNKDLDYLELD
ncbi:MAG: MFS transporter [Saprospiraceae bacterium]|jgi:MFS family permease|nr:MFS transporter [Saprospiraceae bacterium]MBK7437109.1 MFS transporter [Saprospiraceae bacterium]MBK9678245.1 MFS transporter [Saprospiraceae bacterium]MBL0111144.1 MFS transporter [Saprospiraceae bacterium]MBP7800069.1 MFS transporter [Saprospiraceae bacterium]